MRPWVPERGRGGRVIAGRAGGLRLDAAGPGTRPVSDRVKQSLFGLLESLRPDPWAAPVLDLFAGSGALGIEALSRGASAAVLEERDRRAVGIASANLERTGLAVRARVVTRDVGAFLAADRATAAPEAPFGTVFLDPPYAQTADLAAALRLLGDTSAGWLTPDAVLVAKHFWRSPLPERAGGVVLDRVRRFGETSLSVYRRVLEPAAGGE
jgi:16S rRNA (guanine966-N2)-methyltransferase